MPIRVGRLHRSGGGETVSSLGTHSFLLGQPISSGGSTSYRSFPFSPIEGLQESFDAHDSGLQKHHVEVKASRKQSHCLISVVNTLAV